jgi:cytochrome b pre-mRNA-processing protein 3
MIFGLFKKRKNNQAIVARQYAALTETARIPVFYSHLGVPDTVMGRYEMLAIVMILFFRRTARSATSGQELAQEIVDAFFQDLDHSIRELGIGDQGVPKRMKKLAGMFYGRLETYAGAMDANDAGQLAQSLARNIHPEAQSPPDMAALAGWMFVAERHLTHIPEDDISRGVATLPAPVPPDGSQGAPGRPGHGQSEE